MNKIIIFYKNDNNKISIIIILSFFLNMLICYTYIIQKIIFYHNIKGDLIRRPIEN